jgi:hypothetical protein
MLQGESVGADCENMRRTSGSSVIWDTYIVERLDLTSISILFSFIVTNISPFYASMFEGKIRQDVVPNKMSHRVQVADNVGPVGAAHIVTVFSFHGVVGDGETDGIQDEPAGPELQLFPAIVISVS